MSRKKSVLENIRLRLEKLEHLVTTEMIQEKRSKGKQREKMLDGLIQWVKIGRATEALKATKYRDA